MYHVHRPALKPFQRRDLQLKLYRCLTIYFLIGRLTVVGLLYRPIHYIVGLYIKHSHFMQRFMASFIRCVWRR